MGVQPFVLQLVSRAAFPRRLIPSDAYWARAMSYERLHWSVVNVGARVVGLWFVMGSLVFLANAVKILVDEPHRAPIAHDLLIGAIVFGVLGLWLLTTRPYRPDLGDTGFLFAPRRKRVAGVSSERRSWWTGLPLDNHGRCQSS